MSKTQNYNLNSSSIWKFKEYYTDQMFYSEEYALQEFLIQYSIKGLVIRIKKVKDKYQVRMCVHDEDLSSNQINVREMNTKLNHELYDQR